MQPIQVLPSTDSLMPTSPQMGKTGYQHHPSHQYVQNSPQKLQQYGYHFDTQTSVPWAEVFPKKADRFKIGRYQDVWAIILYGLCKCGFIALTVFAFRGVSLLNDDLNRQAQTSATKSSEVNVSLADIAFVVFSVLLAGFLFSFCYFLAIQRFAGTMIKATLIFSIAFNILLAGILVWNDSLVGGLVMLLFAMIYAFFMWRWRYRIPFAKVMLKAVTAITGRYYSVIFVALGGLIIQFIYTLWWAFTLIGINAMFNRSTDNNTVLNILNLYILFMYYW